MAISEPDEALSSEDVLDKLVDAYATKSSIAVVAMETGLTVPEVRDRMLDPAIARRALERKRIEMSLWWVGSGLDSLRSMIEDEDVSASNKLGAIRLMKDLLADMPAIQPQEPRQRALPKPKTLEEMVESLEVAG